MYQIPNFPKSESTPAMALNAAAEVRSCLDAFKRHIQSIEARTNDPRILDATYELENIVMAMWPGDKDVGARADRWRQYGLTPAQERIADMLAARLGRTISRESLMACWTAVGKDQVVDKNLDVHLTRMRKKLATSPYVIKTQYGAGFRMELRPT
jgi:DNA-binding response OmpR family regulator